MTTLADRCDSLLDLAADAIATCRLDLVPVDTIADVFQLATEVLAPAISDRDAEIARLKAELNALRAMVVQQGIQTGLERVRMGRVCR